MMPFDGMLPLLDVHSRHFTAEIRFIQFQKIQRPPPNHSFFFFFFLSSFFEKSIESKSRPSRTHTHKHAIVIGSQLVLPLPLLLPLPPPPLLLSQYLFPQSIIIHPDPSI